MGISIDLYSFDYEKLIGELETVCNTKDRELIEKILLSCGNKIADRYVLLHQELWEDYSCYYNVATVFKKLFNVDDIFEVFCPVDDKTVDMQSLIKSISIEDIFENIGIKMTYDDNDEEDYD